MKIQTERYNMNINFGSFLPSLFTIFLVLKLTRTVDWSWWWITSPLWIPLALVFVILFAVFIVEVFSR